MARSSSLRLSALAFANLLLPLAVLVFASGFFPYKPFLPGLATFEDGQEYGMAMSELPEAIFDRVVFMVVDALRSDFVYGYNSGFAFTQSLIRSGAAIPFTAHATPPTVTMPRVKALTTGSVPSFLDLILNFAESDTTSTLANQDTWLAQIRAKGGKIVFYGDDTWLKLFPNEFFARSDGTSSFFVSDFTEVDNNVTRHVPAELANDDWNAMIMHYLGLDHIGHKTGPQGPNMLPKQSEMDGIVQQIYEAMETMPHHEKTLLVLAGDHGMNAGGNHGGSGPGETEPALLFASPRFKTMQKRRGYECPTSSKDGTEFHYYTKIEQSDVVPALAGLMGYPISKNSLGVFIYELSGFWRPKQIVALLHQNARQLLQIVHAKYGKESFDERAGTYAKLVRSPKWPCRKPDGDEETLAFSWAEVLAATDAIVHDPDSDSAENTLHRFLNAAQDAMSSTASLYDIPKMGTGIGIATIALVLSMGSLPSLWPVNFAGLSFGLVSLLYGVMMFASSYVEEEQHFWYWVTPAWIVSLVAIRSSGRDRRSKSKVATAGAVILIVHRFAVRWNQTGQKHAGEPDIVHTVFPEHHIFMWLLLLSTYVMNGWFLHNRSFAGIFMPEITAFIDVSLVVLGIVFKLNFTQADAPELVQGLASRIREWSEPFSLVMQARAVFGVLAAATIAVVLPSIIRTRMRPSTTTPSDETVVPLSERLHHLLTLFLMTQTRGPNVPLFLGLEMQRMALHWLLRRDSKEDSSDNTVSVAEVAMSTLLLSHVYYFCMGGTNSISSLDLSNAYNGVADYNITAVGVLLFASNWQGPIWWCSAAVLLIIGKADPQSRTALPASEEDKDWVIIEREKLKHDALAATKDRQHRAITSDSESALWLTYLASMTSFIACGLIAVMAACTTLRTHLFIWTVFSPKYLYSMAWSIGWHLVVNIVFGSLLYSLRKIM